MEDVEPDNVTSGGPPSNLSVLPQKRLSLLFSIRELQLNCDYRMKSADFPFTRKCGDASENIIKIMKEMRSKYFMKNFHLIFYSRSINPTRLVVMTVLCNFFL